jgi:DNA-binding transcriptional MerR regulator
MPRTYQVREFARLTKVTARALRYYDQIGLLRPRRRARNGYRLYADRDLIRLQQIVTLKFLGFRLEEIRRILARPRVAVARALAVQVEAVESEIARLQRVTRAIRRSAADLEAGGRIDWAELINIMEDLQMSEDAKKEWTKKFFSEADMKEFEEIGKRYTPETMKAYQDNWTALIAEVQAHLGEDPAGPAAQDLARRWKALLDEGYGGHGGLLNKIGQANKAAWTDQSVPAEMKPPFGPETWDFIRKAIEAG